MTDISKNVVTLSSLVVSVRQYACHP